MASRDADVAIRASNRKLKGDLARSKKHFLGTFGQIKRGAANALGGLGAFGAIQGFSGLASEALNFEKVLTRVAIQGGDIGMLDSLRSQTQGIAKDFGLSQMEVAKGVEEIVNLQGPAGLSSDKLRVLAKASVAAGAGMKEMAGLTFSLENAFGKLSPENLEDVLSAALGIGKQASIPLNELGQVLQQNAKQFSRFASEGKRGAAELVASLQVLRKGFGSTAEAGTGQRAMLNAFEKSEKKLKAYGIRVATVGKDGKRKMRPMVDILDDINKKGLQNKEAFSSVFESAEARAAIRLLIEQKGAMEGLIKIGLESKAVQEDQAAFLASNAGRQQKAFAEAKQALLDLFTPERIEKFTGAIEDLARAVEWSVDNIELLIGAAVAFKAVGLASSVFKAAKAFTHMAENAGGAQSVVSGFKGKSTGGTLGRFASGAASLAGGFLAGMEIQKAAKESGASGAIAAPVEAARNFILAGQRRAQDAKRKRITGETAAIQKLIDADVVSTKGVVDRDIVVSLRQAEESGRELTPVEAAVKRATGSESELGLVTAGLALLEPLIRATEIAAGDPDKAKRELALIAANERLAKAMEEANAKPVEITMDGDKVGEKTRNNTSKKRNEAL